MSYGEHPVERPSRLSLIQTRIRNAVKERLAPGRVEQEVEKYAMQYIRDNVKTVVSIAFGFEKRWTNDWELHRGFEKSAMAAKLNELVNSADVTKFLADAIGDFQKLMGPKTIREWRKKYKEAYLQAFWERADELIDLNAQRDGSKDAEEEFQKIMRETFNTEAEIPQGDPLTEDEEEEDAVGVEEEDEDDE